MIQYTYDDKSDLDYLSNVSIDHIVGGEVILIPTETQYALCCNSQNPEAMKKLNRIKRRDPSIPSAVFVKSWNYASGLVTDYPLGMESFLNAFWPGPLTLVAKCSTNEWLGVVSAEGSIGLRYSSHPLVTKITRSSPLYLTATSANMHNEAPIVDPDAIIKWLEGEVELFIFDPSIRADAVPSTVISIVHKGLQILRKGAIEPNEIERMWEKTIRWEKT